MQVPAPARASELQRKRWWRRRWVRWPLVGIAALIAVPVIVWLGFYFLNRDEPLRPEIEALLKVERPTYDADNAYYALVRVQAPQNADWRRAGYEAIAQVFAKLEAGEIGSTLSPKLEGPGLLALDRPKHVCPQSERNCDPELARRRDEARRWQKVHPVVWQRYLAISEAPYYAEPAWPVLSLMAPLATLAEAARETAVAEWVDGRHAKAIDLIERHNRFCRRVLASGSSLISMMIGEHCVRGGWQLLARLALDDYRAFRPHLSGVRRIVAPLSDAELDMTRVIDAEVRFVADLLTKVDSREIMESVTASDAVVRFLSEPLYLRHMTVNARYEQFERLRQASATKDSDLVGALAQTPVEPDFWTAMFSRNPLGNMLNGFSVDWMYHEYILRIRSLEAMRRLTQLVLNCVDQSLLPHDPQACVESAPPDLWNPFTGVRPTADLTLKALAFNVPGLRTRQPTIRYGK